jgi:hypothetical protein
MIFKVNSKIKSPLGLLLFIKFVKIVRNKISLKIQYLIMSLEHIALF